MKVVLVDSLVDGDLMEVDLVVLIIMADIGHQQSFLLHKHTLDYWIMGIRISIELMITK